MKYVIKISIIFLISISFLMGEYAFARRGCCAWHGGVNHCESSVGRMVCNDGTYSPSCMCERGSKNPKFRPNPDEGEKQVPSIGD